MEKSSETAPSGVLTWMGTLRTILRRTWPYAVGAGVVVLGLWLYTNLFPGPSPLTPNDVDKAVGAALASATPEPAISAEVYQVIFPSLVLIQSQSEDSGEDEGISVGSGVVINENGDILTAFHVVSDAQAIKITFSDGSQAPADLIAADPENDIAVLQPRETPGLVVPAVLGNPFAMRIGDEAFAVGNPLGLAGSMSAGVISGFNRSIPINEAGDQLEGLIQFDAAVNPGNSGGPLLNRAGQVVGIVTALANPFDQGFFTGIGFAVPITVASEAAGAPRY
jgi:S1-C subfamily serine protease